MTAFMYHILVDSYGSIPFTEAILGNENTTPKYDDSKTVVYPGLLAMLDEIIAKKRKLPQVVCLRLQNKTWCSLVT